jgi:hypothetical protein
MTEKQPVLKEAMRKCGVGVKGAGVNWWASLRKDRIGRHRETEKDGERLGTGERWGDRR